jgi:hypothetical protein
VRQNHNSISSGPLPNAYWKYSFSFNTLFSLNDTLAAFNFTMRSRPNVIV